MQHIPILIFVNSFRLGGSERQAVELIKRLDRSRFSVVVACFQREGPLVDELPRDIIALEEFRLSSFANWATCRHAGRFVALLRRTGIKIVQCFDFYSNVFAIPFARLAGVPIILGSRRDQKVMRTWKQQKVDQWCLSLATGVVANSAAAKNQLVKDEGIRPERTWVIHNGLDLDCFDAPERSSRNDEEIRIGIVANLRPEKGHLVFLDAVYIFSQSYSKVRFVIAGDGSMRGKIEARIRELGIKDQVELTGVVKNVSAFLRSGNLDILVNSSDSESLPNAVMEAMAASLPVVATDVGGTNELVVDGQTGYLIKAGDSRGLADRLALLCNDPERSRKMGRAGRNRVSQQFTVFKMARNFENLYMDLVSRST
jgi:glycosyltransferase involved in cell wall biosynthesis